MSAQKPLHYTDDQDEDVSLLSFREAGTQEDVTPLPSADDSIRNAMYIGLNIGSALCLTFLNKIVVADEQLSRCQISFAAYHFFTTFTVLFAATLSPFEVFPRVRIPVLHVILLCLLFNGFLVLGNLSLQYNDMAFYSLARLMTAPTVVLLNFLFFGTTISRISLSSVVILTLGVIVANEDLGFANPFGTSIAVLQFTVTALYQILIGRRITDLKVSPPQLLLNQAPWATLLLLTVVPIFDKKPNFSTIPPQKIVALFASGLCAAMFNISQFLIIGATSALTFNVVGMAKLIGNLMMGWTIQQRFPSIIEILGVGMAIAGTFLYAMATSKKEAVKSVALATRSEIDSNLARAEAGIPEHGPGACRSSSDSVHERPSLDHP